MSPGGDLLLAVMGAGGEPQRPQSDLTAQPPQLNPVDRQRRCGRLQVADRRDLARAEPAQPLRLLGILRQALRERAEHRADQPRPAPPAPVRAYRQPGVDQHHRYPAGGGRQDQIGPQLGFDPQRHVRPPMIEKAPHPAGQVDRDELVARPPGQPFFQQLGRSDGAGRHQDLEAGAGRQQPLDQPQHRGRLADARGVNPHQRSRRPGGAGETTALAQPQPVLLAAALTPVQIEQRQRRQRPGQGAVDKRQHHGTGAGRDKVSGDDRDAAPAAFPGLGGIGALAASAGA